MTCNCRTQIEDKLAERTKSEKPEATNVRADLKGYGFTITGDKLLMKPTMPYEVTMDVPSKAGGVKVKKDKGSMVFSFCPFCGVSLEQAGDA